MTSDGNIVFGIISGLTSLFGLIGSALYGSHPEARTILYLPPGLLFIVLGILGIIAAVCKKPGLYGCHIGLSIVAISTFLILWITSRGSYLIFMDIFLTLMVAWILAIVNPIVLLFCQQNVVHPV